MENKEPAIHVNNRCKALLNLQCPEYRVLYYSGFMAFEEDVYRIPSNFIIFNNQVKKTIGEKTKLSKSAIDKAIAGLVKKGLLLKDNRSRGHYYLNPLAIYKGDLENIGNVTKYLIELGLFKTLDQYE